MAIQDPTSLHALAADAATDIQKLATGLAHAGAAPQAVAQLTQMAEKLNQVVKILGAQPDQGAQAGAPQPGAAPAQPGASQPGAPQQAQPSPQQPEATQPAAPPPGPGHPAIHAATHALHAAVLAAAAARQQPQR